MTKDPIVRLAVVWILLFGFFARAQTFRTPLFDHHSWRQADTAQIARNFWRERFNPAFPQIDRRGAQADGSVETGFELYAFAVAAIARVTGFHYEIGRLLNSLLFLGSAFLVFRFLARRYDVIVGLIGLFVYAFGLPMSLFLDRAFMNEGLLMFLSFGCLTAAQSYLARPRWLPVVALVVSSALIGMIKFPYLIVWAPVAGLFFEASTPRWGRFWPLSLMAALDLTAAALWYAHAHRLGQATGLSFGLFDKTFDPAIVLSWRFVVGMCGRLTRDVLGPVGVVAAAAGLVICVKRRRWAEILGAAAFCAYLVLVARGNDVHDYYQVAVVPIGVALIAVGLGEGLRTSGVSERRYLSLVVAVLALMASTTFIRSVSAHSWYEYDASRLEMCRQLSAQLEPRDLVVFIDDPNPDLLFCVDRRGWLFPPGQWSGVEFSKAWRDGARVIVVPRPSAMLSIPEGMRPRGAPIASAGDLAAYRLEPFPER